MVKIEKIVEISKEVWTIPILKLLAILFGILGLSVLVSFYSTYGFLGISIVFVIISYFNKKYSLGLNMLLMMRVTVLLSVLSLFAGLVLPPLTFALFNFLFIQILMILAVNKVGKLK